QPQYHHPESYERINYHRYSPFNYAPSSVSGEGSHTVYTNERYYPHGFLDNELLSNREQYRQKHYEVSIQQTGVPSVYPPSSEYESSGKHRYAGTRVSHFSIEDTLVLHPPG